MVATHIDLTCIVKFMVKKGGGCDKISHLLKGGVYA
jgi:hypothetical protein